MISLHRAEVGASGFRSGRLIAAAALTAAVALGASGCAMISPQATTIQYAAAEGVNIFASGPIQVRNAFIVANEDGDEGAFVAALVNETDESQTLNITLGEGSDTIQETVRIPARSVLSFGSDETDPLPLEGIDFVAGSDIPGYFESGGSDGKLVSVPVLDGTLAYLDPLAP